MLTNRVIEDDALLELDPIDCCIDKFLGSTRLAFVCPLGPVSKFGVPLWVNRAAILRTKPSQEQAEVNSDPVQHLAKSEVGAVLLRTEPQGVFDGRPPRPWRHDRKRAIPLRPGLAGGEDVLTRRVVEHHDEPRAYV